MLNTFIVPGFLVFAVDAILITLVFKALGFLKFFRLLSWVPEVATLFLNIGIFHWFYTITPEKPDQRLFLIALTAFVITWLWPVVSYVLKDRKHVPFRNFIFWFFRNTLTHLILFVVAYYVAIYLSPWDFPVDFFTCGDAPSHISRFGFYAFWVCCLLTAVYFIAGLALIVLSSRSNQGDHGFFFKKINDLDREDTFTGIGGVIFFTALMTDLVYLCSQFAL